jgi:ERCC4-type nuclease
VKDTSLPHSSVVIQATRPTVIADVFERGSGVPKALEELGARVAMRRLDAGDEMELQRAPGIGPLIAEAIVRELHGGRGVHH